MGKATKQRSPIAKRGRREARLAIIGPTPEQTRHAEYVRAGVAVRRVPAIDTLRDRQMITQAEHAKLAFYRDQALLAERSPTRSCLDDSVPGGDGTGSMSATVTSAMLTTARIERDLGALRDITRAICVEDMSLTEWCIRVHGSRPRYNGSGKLVAFVPYNERRNMEAARAELRSAAGAIVT